MKLLLRYLKPFALALTVSIAFLIVQVLCDLGLPRLMSDMVDTGIQAGGIEQGAPTAISTDGIELLKTFLNEQDAAKAVLDKHLPGFAANPMTGMASGFTLSQLAAFPQANISSEILASIVSDLATVGE
ncbi:hypothetical protein [Cohnella sp.]|uniref:hypothetical protein n=1 Tax=Cohnella sp. TaxID=1883426 RepID=UPI00356339F0